MQKNNLFRFIMLTVSCVLLTLTIGCATPTDPTADTTEISSNNLSRDEVIAHVTNKTEEWSKGAGYYSANGDLDVVWEKKRLTGDWKVTDGGEMCITVAAWGDEDCHSYRLNNGVVELVYKGDGKVRKVEIGNTLDTFL